MNWVVTIGRIAYFHTNPCSPGHHRALLRATAKIPIHFGLALIIALNTINIRDEPFLHSLFRYMIDPVIFTNALKKESKGTNVISCDMRTPFNHTGISNE